MHQKSNIDLLVVSCDSYSDVWDTFFKFFFTCWNDCPLDIYLLTNEKTFDQSPVKTIRVGRDISWSDNLLSGIDQLKKDYVLLLFDDLLLNKKVSTVYFNQLSKWINNHDPNYLRLCISHKPKYFDDLVGCIPNKTPYKTSTMPCIWKISTLKKILNKSESAWDFEIKGSKRAYEFNEFYAVYKNLINYNNGIIKGKWRKTIYEKTKEYGLDVNTISRPVMTSFEEYLYLLRKCRSVLFNCLPNGFRRALKG